jgi:gamma-glutamyltranspeptidase
MQSRSHKFGSANGWRISVPSAWTKSAPHYASRSDAIRNDPDARNLPDKLYLEPGFAPETVDALRKQGYDVSISKGHWSNGECIAVDPKTGELLGGQDHRSHYGKAAGY